MRRGSPLTDRALTTLLAAFVLLGLADAATGTVWPDLRDDLGRSDAAFGWVIAAFAGGYFAATVASGHVAARLGVGTTLRGGAAVSAVALGGLALGPGWAPLLASFCALGVGNGLVDATANAWVATTAGPREMGLLHGFYGVGAVGGPLVATVFVAGGDAWQAPFAVFLAAQLAVGVAFVAYGRLFDATAVSREVAAVASDLPRANRVLAALLVWFALYVGLEVGVGWWTYTMLTEDRGVSEATAGVLVASFWFGLMAGRFGLALGGDRIDPERLMTTASLSAVATTAVLWWDPAGLGGLALLPTGAALAVLFPVAVNRTAVYLGEERAARAVGYQLAASSLGGIALPALIGVAVDRRDAGVVAPIVWCGALAAAASWAAAHRFVRDRR